MRTKTNNKRRFRAYLGIVFGAVFAVAVTLFANYKPNLFRFSAAADDYTITFNRDNGGTGFPSSYSSGINSSGHTKKGNPINFTYNNAKSTSSKYCTLNSGGYLYNSTELTGLESVSVTFSGGSLSLYSSKSETFSGDAKNLTSGSGLTIDPNYDYFKLLASGETVIESITVNYTCAARPEISEITDVITAEDLEATTTQYVSFSGVKKLSDAVYAGSSAKNSSVNIQFRSDGSNTGIVSTTSGGTVSSVKITVASGNKIINVYGSDTAYDAVTELFNTSTQGTKVGSVSSTGTISFTGDNANFTYVGIRSNSGAVYISSIEITWSVSGGSGSGGGGGDTPTPTPTPDPEAIDLTASFPYHNPEPSSINILREDESVFGTLSTSISSVNAYKDYYSEYELAKDEFILITNSNPNVTITSIDVKMYQYSNFDVYVDDSSSYVYRGDGGKVTTNPRVINVTVNASSSVKIVSNGGSNGSGSYSWNVYGVDLYLSGIEGETSVSGVSLNKTSVTIAQEETEQLTATVTPSYATNKNVTWSTSNGSVATVSSSGLVTGVGAGTATITVTTIDGNKTATCTVTVTAVYHVTSVSISPTSLTLHPGNQSSLTATISPSNATNKNVTWTTSNSNIASVNNGTVTAVAAGTATITVTTADGNKTANCTVTVTNISVSSVSLNKSSLTLTRLETETLTATVAPSDATNKNINWSSSNPNIASVSGGTVTAVAVGTAIIYAKSAENASIQATCTVTVNPINVSGVSLNKNELSLAIGASDTLIATVSPANADNNSINWSTSDSSVATVSGGTVTGVAEGTTTITATSAADNTKYATCSVTVTAATDCTIDLTEQGFSNQETISTVTSGSFTLTFAKASGNNAPAYYTSGSSVRTYANNTLTVATSGSDKITQIVFTLGTTATATPTVNTGSYSSTSKTWTGSATSIVFTNASTGQYHYKTVTITVTPSAPVTATGVSLPSSQEIAAGGSATLPLTYTPANANTGLAVTWEKLSGSSSKINVDSSGKVSVDSSATSSATATIRVTLTSNGAYADCTISVVEVALDEWTLLFYVCGADLESATVQAQYGYQGNSTTQGCASDDIDEILATKNQPDSVNIVLETGGANKWARSDLNSHKSKLAKWHITNKSLVFDREDTYANMGESSTLQEFLTWGITNYPAKKYGLFMWNHGGALDGCCFDEKSNDDSLTASEVNTAVQGAKSTCGISSNLEFIAYDACLMAVQDIAEINSQNFNYMIASQESEYSGGYDYDQWLPTLYNNPSGVSTKTLLTKVASTFMDEQTSNINEYNDYYNLSPGDSDYWANDQTQSVLDLTKMSTYKDRFESLATTLKNSSSVTWSKLQTAINKAQKYGFYEDYQNNSTYNYGYVYNIFDIEQALTEIGSISSSFSSQISSVKSALNDVVVYEEHGDGTTGCGLNLFCPIARLYSKSFYQSTTNFSNWYALLTQSGYGSWSNS